MSIKSKFRVEPIPNEQTYPWLLEKHYAHRIPSIMYAFGLFDENKKLQGVCTFGMPCMQMNDGNCIFRSIKVKTLELTRLITNDGLERNTLSFFVSWSIKLLNKKEKSLCLVSFADPNNGHQGYIYQATNWLYTGQSEKGGKNKNFIFNGHNFHGNTVTVDWCRKTFGKYDSSKTLDENFIQNGGMVEDFGLKHRYIKFLGSENERKEMLENTVYRFRPYPKGENKRYDTSKVILTTNSLF